MNIKPCPFCGSSEVDIKENYYLSGQQSKPTSVTLRHWCNTRSRIEFVGSTKEEIIDLWNNRIVE